MPKVRKVKRPALRTLTLDDLYWLGDLAFAEMNQEDDNKLLQAKGPRGIHRRLLGAIKARRGR